MKASGNIHFGFDPTCCDQGLSHLQLLQYSGDLKIRDRDKMLSQAETVLNTAFSESVERVAEASTHVVPLSGGLDSRTVLAGLLDHVPKERVETVSFGMPGLYDYELSAQVADFAGVEHTQVKVTEINWSIEALERTARRTGTYSQLFEFNVYRESIYDRYPDNAVFWDGYMGDALTGAHLASEPFNEWEEACEWFCEFSRFVEPNVGNPEAAKSLLPDKPFINQSEVPYDEQLDYGVRQTCYIQPRPTESTQIFPFLEGNLPSFMLALPRQWRVDQKFFEDLLLQWKPSYFKLPTETYRGVGLGASKWRKWAQPRLVSRIHKFKSIFGNSIHPAGMYWDWNEQIRGDLRDICEELIISLANREVNISPDPAEVFESHIHGENLARTVRALCSYELYLRVSNDHS